MPTSNTNQHQEHKPDPASREYPSTPTQGLHLSPPDLERAARQLLARNTSVSLLSLRVAAWGARHHGNAWFRIHDARVLLTGSGREGNGSGKLAKQLRCLDICETQVIADGSRQVHYAKVTCQLYPDGHHHGRKSAVLVEAMNRFAESHSCGTPFALLLLIATHVYQIHQSAQLGEFLEPTPNPQRNLARATRILKWLHACGLVQIRRIHAHDSRPFLVFPVGRQG